MKKLVCRFLCLGIVLAVSMNLVGCSDDDGPVGTLYFPRDVCMVDKPGGNGFGRIYGCEYREAEHYRYA